MDSSSDNSQFGNFVRIASGVNGLKVDVKHPNSIEISSLKATTEQSWASSFLDALVIMLSALGCGWLTFPANMEHGTPLALFITIGAGVTLVYRTTMRAILGFGAGRIGIVAYSVTAWTLAFSTLAFLAYSFELSTPITARYAMLFYFTGAVGLIVNRVVAPGLSARVQRLESGLIWYFERPEPIIIGAHTAKRAEALYNSVIKSGRGKAELFHVNVGVNAEDWTENLRSLVRTIGERAHAGHQGDIYVVAAGFTHQQVNALLSSLQRLPLGVRLVPSPEIEQLLHYPVRHLGETPAVEIQSAPLSSVQRFFKRAIDFSIALLALLFLLPFLLTVALAVKLDSRGSVLFSQTRLGKGGKPFRIYKFRSMLVMEDGANIVQAQKGDPRVTRVGSILRRTSIDELPQLLNVLKGDMSLVGPRPHAVAHDQLYMKVIDNYSLRQCVKPGITGWAQVHGLRGETKTTEMMRARIDLDVWYATHATVMLDIIILVRTAAVVLFQRNAY